MAGRFPLYTDADVQGPVIKALRQATWDLIRAIEAFPEGTPDLSHFERAALLNRALVTNDTDQIEIAEAWLAEGRPFVGVIWWPQAQYDIMSPGNYLRRFEEYAAQDNPFAGHPILYLKAY